jgi:hypothetical protein
MQIMIVRSFYNHAGKEREILVMVRDYEKPLR